MGYAWSVVAYMPEFDMSRKLKSLQRQPVTFDMPLENGEKCGAATGGRPLRGPPRIGRLESLADWKRQIGKVYRMVRRGELPSSEGSRLVFILQAGAQITREESRELHEKELREQVTRLQEQLEALKGGRTQPALPAPETQELPDWAREGS